MKRGQAERRNHCYHCGIQATCYGRYGNVFPCYCCDDCCGHGNEDGHCEPVEDLPWWGEDYGEEIGDAYAALDQLGGSLPAEKRRGLAKRLQELAGRLEQAED